MVSYKHLQSADMKKAAKTRNLNTLTESQFWSFLRSGLRRQFRYWKPMLEAKKLVKRNYKGTNKKQKFEYQCNHCKDWFKDANVQIDHIIPVGSLLDWDDVVPFLKKLIPEDAAAFQVLCKECHQVKTNKERVKKGEGD